MIHDLVKYLVKTRLCLWDIKITNFYISQTKSSFEKIFYKVVYHHIIYMYNFLVNLDNFFCSGLHRFSRKLRFPHPTLQGLYFSMACLFRLQDHTICIVSLYNQSSNACLSLLLTDLVMKFWEKIRRFVPFHVDLWWNTFFLMMKHGGEGWKSCSHESNCWMYDEGSCKHASAMQLDAEDRVAIMHPFFKIYPLYQVWAGFQFQLTYCRGTKKVKNMTTSRFPPLGWWH